MNNENGNVNTVNAENEVMTVKKTVKLYQLDERKTIKKALKDGKEVLKDEQGKTIYETLENPNFGKPTFQVIARGNKELAEILASAIVRVGDLKVNCKKLVTMPFATSKPCYFASNNIVLDADCFMRLRFKKDASYEEYVFAIRKLIGIIDTNEITND